MTAASLDQSAGVAVERLLAALEAAGCRPRRSGVGWQPSAPPTMIGHRR
jgi:hypothetical protein